MPEANHYRDLVTARMLAARVAEACMSRAFMTSVLAGKQDDSPAITAIVDALREARAENNCN